LTSSLHFARARGWQRHGTTACQRLNTTAHEIIMRKENVPVRIGHLLAIHAPYPRLHILLLLVRQWIPEIFIRNSQGEPNRTCLDHPLIDIIHVSPKLCILRIRSRDQSLHKPFRMRILAPTSKQWCQPPQWTSISLDLCCCFVKPRARATYLDHGILRRKSQNQRI